MELGAVEFLVVHRRDFSRVLLGFALDLLVIDARRRGHVQPPRGFDEVRVVDANEVRLGIAG
ncbi:Uncharacterised protein [Mycobacteroides abscessus subsp. massiliense]|nr:Uncharacterised protein [Mycobacteroides abscessus subsp. massiliense]